MRAVIPRSSPACRRAAARRWTSWWTTPWPPAAASRCRHATTASCTSVASRTWTATSGKSPIWRVSRSRERRAPAVYSGTARIRPALATLRSRCLTIWSTRVKRVVISLLAMSVSTALMAAPPKFDGVRISADVKELSSDAYEGRSPATAGEEKTIAYLSRQFAEAGLQPGGDLHDGKRLWTQAVPLLKGDIVGTPQLSLTRDGASQSLTQGQEIAVRAAMNGDSQVAIDNAPLVFVGYGVKAPERNWDDFKGVDLKG